MKKTLVICICLISMINLLSCSSEIEYKYFDLYDFGKKYTENNLKAEKEFLNEYVYLEGYTSGIKSDKFWLYADIDRLLYEYSHAVCFFDNKNSDLTDVLQNVSEGDKIRVYGKIIKIEDSYPTDNIHLKVIKVEIIKSNNK